MQGPPEDFNRISTRSFYKDLYKIMQGPRPGQPFCASLRCRHVYGHLTRPILCENWQEKCHASGQPRDPHFVRACAIEMHMDVSQEQFYARIYSKNAVPQRVYPDLTLALNTYRKNPSVCTHCLGTWGRGWMTKASGVGERRKGRGELRRDCHHRVAALFVPTRMQQWYIDIWYITMIYMGEGAGGGPFAGKITWCPWGAPEYVLKQEDSSELTLAFVIMTIIANNDKM